MNTLDKLTQEGRYAFATEDKTNILALYQLLYLCAVLQETLRTSPPIMDGFPHKVPKPGAI